MHVEKCIICVFLCRHWKKGMSAKAAAVEICEVEGDECTVSKITAVAWFKRLNNGKTSLGCQLRPGGRPSTMNIVALRREPMEQ